MDGPDAVGAGPSPTRSQRHNRVDGSSGHRVRRHPASHSLHSPAARAGVSSRRLLGRAKVRGVCGPTCDARVYLVKLNQTASGIAARLQI